MRTCQAFALTYILTRNEALLGAIIRYASQILLLMISSEAFHFDSANLSTQLSHRILVGYRCTSVL